MTRRSRLGTPGFLARHLAHARASSVLLAILVGVAVLVAALVPRGLAVLAQNELTTTLSSVTPLRTDMSAVGLLGIPPVRSAANVEELFGPLDKGLRQIPSTLESPLREFLGDPSWYIRTGAENAAVREPRSDVLPRFTLGISVDRDTRIHFVDGVAPTRWTGNADDRLEDEERPPLEIAISQDAATKLSLQVGDVMDYPNSPLVVTGIYEVDDPDDPYWVRAYPFRTTTLVRTDSGGMIGTASVYIDPMSAIGLQPRIQSAEVYAWYPANVASARYAEAPVLLEQVRQIASLGESLYSGEPLTFQTSVGGVLEGVIARVVAVTALLSLVASAPLGVVFAVLSLGVQAVIGRRRLALQLAAARGASTTGLRAVMLLEGALVALPTSAIALVLAALLVPADVGPDATIVPLIVALATPALFVASTSAAGQVSRRFDLSPRSRSRVRWVVEVTVVALAGLGLFLLARRGLLAASGSVGVDPLLVGMPLLLALAVSVLALRLFPLPVLAIGRGALRRRGAVGMLGASRAAREPSTGFAAMLAIIVGVAAAIFALVMAGTVSTGLERSARETVGADLRVQARDLPTDLIERIRSAEGVEALVGIDVDPDTTLDVGYDELHVSVAFADLAELAVVRPDIPRIPQSADSIPFLASPEIAERMTNPTTELAGLPATLAGEIALETLPTMSFRWLLVDSSFQERLTGDPFEPDKLLVSLEPGADHAAVRNEVERLTQDAQDEDDRQFVEVEDAAVVLDEEKARPATGYLIAGLLVAGVVALALGILTIVLGSIAATSGRNRLFGVMRLLGMSPRQLAGVVVWELAPVVLTGVVAGTALGIVLPYIVTAVLDLRAFVGGSAAVLPTIPVALVAGVAAGYAAVALLAGAISVAAGRRADPAITLKMGAE